MVRRSLYVVLAALFGALTIAQSTIPISSPALSSTPGFAIPYHIISHHAVEEVGSRPVEPEPAGLTTLSPEVVVNPDRGAYSAIRFDQNDATEWLHNSLARRRSPPPSTDDD